MAEASELEKRRFEGKVKFFDPKNNFGFIQVSETNLELYFKGGDAPVKIQEGDGVSFLIKDQKKGLSAYDIIFLQK